MRVFAGDADDDEGESLELPDEILLPLPLASCLELWNGYQQHGVLAVAGGLLDQPRWWRRLIRIMNAIYNPIYKTHIENMFPDRGGRQDGGLRDLWYGDMDDVGDILGN